MRFIVFFALLMPLVAQAAAPNWNIDAAQSSITFTDTQSGQKFPGGFKKFTGEIAFDPAHLDQSHALITIDTSSIAVGGDGDQYITAPAWLDSAKFPAAKFTANKFEKTAAGYIAHGQLTIRDVTVPLDLPFTLTITPDDKRADMQGDAVLHRLDYHIGTGEWADPKTVGFDVPVHVKILADRKVP